MSDWVYSHQYLKVDGKRATDLAALQKRGADGWELVSALRLSKRARRAAGADVLLLFKRSAPGGAGSKAQEGSGRGHRRDAAHNSSEGPAPAVAERTAAPPTTS